MNKIPEGRGSSLAGALANGSPHAAPREANPGSAVPGGVEPNPLFWQPRADECQGGCVKHCHGYAPCHGECFYFAAENRVSRKESK